MFFKRENFYFFSELEIFWGIHVDQKFYALSIYEVFRAIGPLLKTPETQLSFYRDPSSEGAHLHSGEGPSDQKLVQICVAGLLVIGGFAGAVGA